MRFGSFGVMVAGDGAGLMVGVMAGGGWTDRNVREGCLWWFGVGGLV